MNRRELPGLPRGQTVFIIVLTALYLVVELAFNARLLDVAGGLQVQGVHGLENFGRTLSGIAVALFVLQHQLGKRARRSLGPRDIVAIALLCAASALATFVALKWVVEGLVDRPWGEFRRASTTLVIVRSEMLRGDAVLDGLHDDATLFERPEGKAFAAIFPLLGVQIWPQIDQRLGPVRKELIRRALGSSLGGAKGYYDGPYRQARDDLEALYRGHPPPELLHRIAGQEDERAWADYRSRLAKRKLTPETVPWFARKKVWQEVRARVPVPGDWDLSDRGVFSRAVQEEVARQLRTNPASVFDDGRIVAQHLSWSAYVDHPVTQRHLRDGLRLPASVRVQADYASAAAFDASLFQPMLAYQSEAELNCLNDRPGTFLAGGANAERGRESAQAALVPPIALLCSLLGAISHLAKLTYQLARLLLGRFQAVAPLRRFVLLVPLAVLLLSALAIAGADNAITLSRTHRYLRATALEAVQTGMPAGAPRVWVPLVLGAVHAVEIGQGYGYPLNNFMRLWLLGGFQFDSPIRASNPAPRIERRVGSGCGVKPA